MAELKPCPFCGGIAHFIETWVVCVDCGAETSCFESREEAAEAWTKRAGECYGHYDL